MALSKYFERTYVILKFTSLTLAFLYSLAYSDKLGPFNRSVLTFVFLSTLIIVGLLTTGTMITLRTLNRELVSCEVASFLSLSLFQLLIGLLLFTCSLFGYSEIKNKLDYKYILLGILFYMIAHISILFGEYFSYKKKFIDWAKFEVFQVLMQIIIYLLFINLAPQTSLAVVVIISFSVSTLLITSLAFFTIPRKTIKLLKLGVLNNFWKISKQNNLTGLLFVILKYIDKFIIALFFATEILAIYSIFFSLIYFFRFIPEYLSKLIAVNNIEYKEIKNLKVSFKIFIYFLFLTTIAIMSRLLIENTLGSEWILPITVCIFIAIQEFLYNCYIVISNFKFSSTGKNSQINSAKLTLIIFLISAIYPIHSENLEGLICSLSLAYLTAILYSMRCHSNE